VHGIRTARIAFLPKRWQRPHFALPLLGKALIEKSARRRTYAVRVAYAILLYGTVGLLFPEYLPDPSDDSFDVLGSGDDLFNIAMWLQVVGIYLFVPVMASGAITQEKEQRTLSLLFISRLGPWTILFEKILAEFVVVISFLLIGLPLMGFAYTLGGVSQTQLWMGTLILLLTALQLIAISVMCSAFFRTTGGAMAASFALIYGYLFEILLMENTLWDFEIGEFLTHWIPIIEYLTEWGIVDHIDNLPYSICCIHLLEDLEYDDVTLAQLIPLAFSTLLLILAARIFLVRRAFARPAKRMIRLMQFTDRILESLNRRLAFGITLSRKKGALPLDNPIAWRGLRKHAWGQCRHLSRILIVFEISVLVGFTCLIILDFDYSDALLIILALGAWFFAVIYISAFASSVFPQQRATQSLDILLTTTISGREIVRQNFRSVSRLIILMSVPLLTICLFQSVLASSSRYSVYSEFDMIDILDRQHPATLAANALCSVLSVLAYLPMIGWLSFWIGLRARTAYRAICISLAVILSWLVLPLFILIIVETSFPDFEEQVLPWIYDVSPFLIVVSNLTDGIAESDEFEFAWMWAQFAVHSWIMLIFRGLCLRQPDRRFNRL